MTRLGTAGLGMAGLGRAGRQGAVTSFDEAAGYGELTESTGDVWWFHCTGITDDTRTIEVGAPVRFQLRPGHLGRYEAIDITPA
jgi:cold shock CspA family protein